MMRAARVTEATPELANEEVSGPGLDEDGRRSSLGARRSAHGLPGETARHIHVPSSVRLDVDSLRRHAWEIGSRRPHATYVCPDNYVNLCAVGPGEAFLTWRLQQSWGQETAAKKGNLFHGARLVLRLYDVSFIEFNGFNAHRMRDIVVDSLSGERLVPLPLSGTMQLAELGYLLPKGEFVPAARSTVTAFPSASVSNQHDVAALYVDERLLPEPVASPWEGASFLRERRKPRLRQGLRIAMLSFAARPGVEDGAIGTFVRAVAGELVAQGMEVHVFAPRAEGFRDDVSESGVHYQALDLGEAGGAVEAALGFARALEARLAGQARFDCFHVQEWMTGLVPWLSTRPATVAFSSIESLRRNGGAPDELSREIERLESEVARAAECLMLPPWLHERAVAVLGLDETRVHAFPLQGRPMDEWELPFDAGKAKSDIGLAPGDRMLTFVGALEWAGGPDLIVEGLSPVLARAGNARVVFVGCGSMQGALVERARRLGVGHAVRFLGHLELPHLIPLLRASEGLVLPSRQRVAEDHGVVGLARRAAKPVLTTHGGPAQLVQHEKDGLIVYDNPPSLVWGMSRLLDDPRHGEEMGRNGHQQGQGSNWGGVARAYADLCAAHFAELREAPLGAASQGERGRAR